MVRILSLVFGCLILSGCGLKQMMRQEDLAHVLQQVQPGMPADDVKLVSEWVVHATKDLTKQEWTEYIEWLKSDPEPSKSAQGLGVGVQPALGPRARVEDLTPKQQELYGVTLPDIPAWRWATALAGGDLMASEPDTTFAATLAVLFEQASISPSKIQHDNWMITSNTGRKIYTAIVKHGGVR